MIGNIQLLRGLAALAVAFYHTSYPLPPYGLHTHFNGVAVFFVVSGFVMTYIRKDSASRFLKDRFARIVPFYWAVSGAMVILACTGLLNPPYTFPTLATMAQEHVWRPFLWLASNFQAAMTSDERTVIVQSALFIPMPMAKGPVLGVGWSLNLEVFYYALFWLSLMISKRFAPLLVAAALIGLRLAGPAFDDFYWNFYTSQNNDYFVAGIVLCYAWMGIGPMWLLRHRAVVIPAGLLVAAGYLWAHASYDLFYLSNPLIPFGLVLAAVTLHSANVRCNWKPALVLGEASYALYLVHLIVLEAMRPIGAKWPAFNVAIGIMPAALSVAVSVLIAVAIHYWIEKPLVRAGRLCLDRMSGGPKTAFQTT